MYLQFIERVKANWIAKLENKWDFQKLYETYGARMQKKNMIGNSQHVKHLNCHAAPLWRAAQTNPAHLSEKTDK